MASLLSIKVCNFLFISSSIILLISIDASVSAHEFVIGGANGWTVPMENETDSYLEWAATNRFHVGDTVYFKYIKNDSVLVVNLNDYINCNISNPIAKFEDGNTVFRFDRYGFFYFISGNPVHCKSGQRVVIRVMVHPEEGFEPSSPRSAPSPWAGAGGPGTEDGPGSDEWGSFSPNSTVRLSVASYFLTALGGMMVILYLFI